MIEDGNDVREERNCKSGHGHVHIPVSASIWTTRWTLSKISVLRTQNEIHHKSSRILKSKRVIMLHHATHSQKTKMTMMAQHVQIVRAILTVRQLCFLLYRRFRHDFFWAKRSRQLFAPCY